MQVPEPQGLWWQIALWGLDDQGAESTAPGLAENALRLENIAQLSQTPAWRSVEPKQ